MTPFRLDADALARARARADVERAAGGAALLARLDAGERLSDPALAALLLCDDVLAHALLQRVAARRAGPPRIETFSPLYLTNECDAECAMCGMRGNNGALVRETADADTVERQLDLLHARGLRGVALLTGEYHHGPRRRAMLARVARALRAALERGFGHVLVNVGALEAEEYGPLLAGIPRDEAGRLRPHVTMCTFQETYDRERYRRFMGTRPENPRADFGRRLGNFDRAADAGMTSVNPGVLLGLDRDVASEFLALLAHVRHLLARGLRVYASLPRLRKASGAAHRVGVPDETLHRFVALLALAAPEARIVISTRESPAVQRRLLPAIHVLTPGSPGVAPYTATGARFELEASQFEVLDDRPIEIILGEVLAGGTAIDCYEPRVGA